MSEDRDISQNMLPLFHALEKDYLDLTRPKLAHYTTIPTFEKILLNNELWLANPLFMNDHEELRWGIQNGIAEFLENKSIRYYFNQTGSYDEFAYQINWQLNQFETEQAFDTYIFCLSEHEDSDEDGKLSMWRAYGANGDGVALVFKTEGVPLIDDSPIIIAPVNYETHASRHQQLKEIADMFAVLITDAKVQGKSEILQAAYYLFERLKIFSIFTKHIGFREEQEWRVVYLRDRDHENLFKDRRHYINNGRGIEPKLKLKFGPGEPGIHPDIKLDDLIDKIILGPSHASALAEKSIKRMVELIGREALIPKIKASTIPFRKA